MRADVVERSEVAVVTANDEEPTASDRRGEILTRLGHRVGAADVLPTVLEDAFLFALEDRLVGVDGGREGVPFGYFGPDFDGAVGSPACHTVPIYVLRLNVVHSPRPARAFLPLPGQHKFVKERIQKVVRRAKFAAAGGAVGGAVGGLVGRNAASTAAGVGAMVGATLAEKIAPADTIRERLQRSADAE